MALALACRKCGNMIASDRMKLDFDGHCPWCLASFALVDPPPDDAASTPLVPCAKASDRLGKYLLTEKLGTGGMGEVWKALDTELNRWVALKFLKTQDPKELARFTREAHMAAKLSHPNIAAVYEIGEIGGRHYIAMQCIEGRTLETFRTNDRRLLVRLCLDAAKALDHAHRHKVIHRDVKPGNLMVEETEEGTKVVVLDFGLARSIEGGEKLSMSGSVVGTPQYLSPEQARAEKLDERTDVYSLGATMYEIFTGKPLFEGENVYEILKKIENEAPTAPRKIKPQINQDLQTIILKCLEKDRERRYAGAKALAQDLRRFLNHEAVLARPPSAIYQLRMKLSKRKSLVAAVAALLVLVAGAAVLLPRMGAEARARDRLAEYQSAYDEGRNAWDEILQMIRRAPFGRTLDKVRRARGHFEKAIGILDQADAQVMRGRCLQLERKPREAEGSWERALVLDPGNQEASFHLVKRLLSDYLDAQGHGDLVGSGNSTVASVRFDSGPESQDAANLRRRAEKLLAAVGLGEKAVYLRGLRALCLKQHREGADLLAQYNREGWDSASCVLEGLARLYIPDFAGAIKACTGAIEIDPNYLRAYLVRGVAKGLMGLYEEAIADFDFIINLDSKHADAYNNRGAANRRSGHLDDALKDLDRAIELAPNSLGAFCNRAQARCDKGLYEGAIKDYTRAIELDPKDAGTYNLRGQAKRAKGLEDDAIKDFDEAIKLNPGFANAYNNRGMAREGKGFHNEAIADYDLAIKLDPKDANAWSNRGMARRAVGLLDDAIKDYDEAIRLYPEFANAYSNRGNAYSDKGLHDKAFSDHDEAVRLDPKSALSRYNRGVAKRAKGLLVEAIADFTEAINLDPNFAAAYYNRGVAKCNKGLYDEAIKDFTKTIELEPKAADAYLSRGDAKSDTGHYDEAIEDFTKAIELDPESADAYVGRGIAKWTKGLVKEAMIDWEKALEFTPPEDPYRAVVEDFLSTRGERLNVEEAHRLHGQKKFREAIAKCKGFLDSHPNHALAKSCAYNIACAYALLAEKKNALDWLEKAVDMGWKDLAHLEKDSDLDSLRGEERYPAIVKKLKQK